MYPLNMRHNLQGQTEKIYFLFVLFTKHCCWKGQKRTFFTTYSYQNYLLRLKHLKGISKKQIIYLLQLQLYESITSRQLTNQLCSTSIDVKQMAHKLFNTYFSCLFSFSFTFRILRHCLTLTYFLNTRKMSSMISEIMTQ